MESNFLNKFTQIRNFCSEQSIDIKSIKNFLEGNNLEYDGLSPYKNGFNKVVIFCSASDEEQGIRVHLTIEVNLDNEL